ncbi:MAG: peptide ABC transporter substrate-binding protein, partial [Acidimicrobiia bacterium]
LKAFEDAPIGNGPYQMDGKWEHDRRIKVKRFADYKGTPGKADAIEFRIYSENLAAFRDLQGGSLDVVGQIPPEQIPTAAQEFGERFLERPNSSFSYLGFPLYVPAFQKKEIRQALSMAINREEITKTIFDGTRVPASSVVSPIVNGSRKDACKYCRFDPVEAKRLYEKAGGIKGTLAIWFNSGAGHDEWVEAVANQWRQNLGITEVKYETLEFAEYLPKLDDEAVTGPFRLGWVMDYPSPQNYLQPIYSTTGSSNNSAYSNKAFDDLLAQGNRATTVDAGIELYQQAEDLLLEDLPVIPLWFGRNQSVHSERVSGVIVDAYGNVRVADIEVKG